MKKSVKFSLPAILCLIFSLSCNAQKLFGELAAIKGVESTYIGPGMMSSPIVQSIVGNGEFGGRLPSGIIEELKTIEIIEADNTKTVETVKSTAKKILEKLHTDILMETIDGDDIMVIYGIPSSKGKDAGYTDLIIVSYEPCDYNLIHISGKINMPAQ